MSLHLFVWWGLLGLLIVLAVLVFASKNKLLKLVALIGFVFLGWSFLIEKNLVILQTINHQIPELAGKRVVLVSDLHVGVYKSERFYKKIADKINFLSPDLVIIAGDFVYYPAELEKELEFLQNISAQKVAVLGNHDLEYKHQLKEILQSFGVQVLENSVADFEDLEVYGLGELWEDNANPDIVPNDESFKIVIAHNPDVFLLKNFSRNSLLVSGHTHCGQIKIPVLYKSAIPTRGEFTKEGWNNAGENKVFISCGAGEIGLPMRLFNPPKIYLFK